MPTYLAKQATDGPEFPASYGEDTHLGLLCRRLGAKGRFERGLQARHLHTRTARQFLSGAFEHGVGTFWLHRLHADLVGDLDPEQFLRGLPRPLRRVVEELAHSDAGTWSDLACSASELVGRAGWQSGQIGMLRLMRRVAAHRGLVWASEQATSLEAKGEPTSTPTPKASEARASRW